MALDCSPHFQPLPPLCTSCQDLSQLPIRACLACSPWIKLHIPSPCAPEHKALPEPARSVSGDLLSTSGFPASHNPHLASFSSQKQPGYHPGSASTQLLLPVPFLVLQPPRAQGPPPPPNLHPTMGLQPQGLSEWGLVAGCSVSVLWPPQHPAHFLGQQGHTDTQGSHPLSEPQFSGSFDQK
jgi:hypothetical protein